MAKFEDTIIAGREAEERIRRLLQEAGGLAGAFGKTSSNDFSLVLGGHAHRVEVKNEDNYAASGNICVEFIQGAGTARRWSGLAISEATICIHTLKLDCALYRRVGMAQHLQVLHRTKTGWYEKFPGSDNDNGGYIISVSSLKFKPWFDFVPINGIGNSKLWLD